MPSATTSTGVVFFYEDSGTPAQAQYVTLIFFHGMGLTGAVFRRLFPVARCNGARIITVNRRDYPGSTPLSEEERKRLGGTPEEQNRFLCDEGLNIAHLVHALIQEHELQDITLVAWSLSVSWVYAMLANFKDLPSSVSARLQQHIKSVVFHDPSTPGLGLTNPPEYNIDLWFTPDPETRHQLFLDWCSAYYDHEDITSRDAKKISFNTPTSKPRTFHDLSKEQIKELSAWEPFAGSDTFVLFINPDIAKGVVRRAFFDPALASEVLPGLKVRFIYGRESIGTAPFACWAVEDNIESPTFFDGKKARDIKVLHTEKGNHFVFWDYPDVAFAEYQKCMTV